jgi:hypothetical protein
MNYSALKNSILNSLRFEDETSLRDDYEGLKTQSFKPNYGLHIPPQDRTITRIHDVLSELSSRYQEIVVFAVDAISFDYYLDGIRGALPKGAGEGVLSSVFPTATATGWTSIITGSAPSEHGVYGTSYLLEHYNHNYIWVSSCLSIGSERKFLKELDGVKLIQTDHPTIFEKLNSTGYDVHFLDSYIGSSENPFLRELTRGARFVEAPSNELIKKPQELLEYFMDETDRLLSTATTKKLIWNYVDFDAYVHDHTYSGLARVVQWKSLFEYWESRKKEGRVFLFISDHGQIEQSEIPFNILEKSIECPHLEHNSGGVGRTVYFYPNRDAKEQAREWINTMIGDTGTIFERDDLSKLGLFNKPVQPERIGEYVAVAKTRDFPSTGNQYRSEHGALTAEEVFVPIVIYGD